MKPQQEMGQILQITKRTRRIVSPPDGPHLQRVREADTVDALVAATVAFMDKYVKIVWLKESFRPLSMDGRSQRRRAIR